MALSENPTFTTMAEILETLEGIIPEEIRKRYCVGEIWKQIVQERQRGPDEIIQGPTGLLPLKKLLAAYLVNIIVQSLFQELVFNEKVDPQSRKLIPLSAEEIETIKKTIPLIVEFVKTNLGVPVNQRHVQIDDNPDPSHN